MKQHMSVQFQGTFLHSLPKKLKLASDIENFRLTQNVFNA